MIGLGMWASATTLMQAARQTHLLIVVGIGGEPFYSERFHEWAVTMIDAAESRWGIPPQQITYLGERVERDSARIDARSTKAEMEQAIAGLVASAGPDDLVFLLLVGHGNTQDAEPRFNLPGPDITAGELAALLDQLSSQRIAFVNTTTASGDFLPILAGPNRVVVTATKTGFERNESVFGGFFVEAYGTDDADQDKDQRISVLEAFTYAAREVRRSYEADKRLLTEHALLDDNGDGEGSEEPSVASADGSLASTFVLTAPVVLVSGGGQDSTLVALHRDKMKLEEDIAALRSRRASMNQDDYDNKLEELLVQLALVSRQIREREGGTR